MTMGATKEGAYGRNIGTLPSTGGIASSSAVAIYIGRGNWMTQMGAKAKASCLKGIHGEQAMIEVLGSRLVASIEEDTPV
jgi:hypothetical protein